MPHSPSLQLLQGREVKNWQAGLQLFVPHLGHRDKSMLQETLSIVASRSYWNLAPKCFQVSACLALCKRQPLKVCHAAQLRLTKWFMNIQLFWWNPWDSKTASSFQRAGNGDMEKQLTQGHPRSCTSLGLTPHLIVLSTRLSVFPAYLFPAVSFSGAFLLFA